MLHSNDADRANYFRNRARCLLFLGQYGQEALKAARKLLEAVDEIKTVLIHPEPSIQLLGIGNHTNEAYVISETQIVQVCPFCETKTRRLEFSPGFLNASCGGCAPLKGRNLTVTYFGAPPFIVYGAPVGLTGVDVELMRILGDKFQANLKFVPETLPGKYDEESRTWNGNVGNVNNLFVFFEVHLGLRFMIIIITPKTVLK